MDCVSATVWSSNQFMLQVEKLKTLNTETYKTFIAKC